MTSCVRSTSTLPARLTHHGSISRANTVAATLRDRSPEPKADLPTDWSWFGPGEPDRAAPRNTVALMSAPTVIDRTRALLTMLAELDVRPNDRVLIMLPAGPGFTESFAAAFYRDAVPLPINPLLSAPDLAAAATQAHARLVLATPQQLPTLTQLHSQPPIHPRPPRTLGSRTALAINDPSVRHLG